MAPRYAIYFAPADGTALADFGTGWLNGAALASAAIDPALQAQVTASPRRYGFHATLKAPFRLAEQSGESDLRSALAAFAAGRPRPVTPPLALRNLEGFLALMLSEPAPEVTALAQACVESFEGFRAPLSEADLTRRRAAKLTARQDANLLRWGYPYVDRDFRFHMTLTERLSETDFAAVWPVLETATAAHGTKPLDLDAISLFREDTPGDGFTPVARFPLAG